MLYRSTLLCHFNFHMESRRHHIVLIYALISFDCKTFNNSWNFYLFMSFLYCNNISKGDDFPSNAIASLDGFKPLSIA